MRFHNIALALYAISLWTEVQVGAIPFQGVNLAGLEFYSGNGDADYGYVDKTYNDSDFLRNENGSFTFQINHFTSRGYNMFRIPFSWQRLQPQVDGTSTLNSTYLNYIQDAVTLIAQKNASVIVDVHNYARVDGEIIGQGQGPSSSAFAAFWAQLAHLWSSTPNVWFGLMNEPHHLDMGIWSQTLQQTVNQIRTVANNTILLPGTDYTGLPNWITDSYPFLRNITDPYDVSTLVYDIHHYWDGDGGNLPSCNDTVPEALFPIVSMQLAADSRVAFLSETGGGNYSSCEPYLNATLGLIDNPNWLGYTAWGAGEFAATAEQYSFDFNYTAGAPSDQTPDALTLSPNPITEEDTPQFLIFDRFRTGSTYCLCGSGYCPGGMPASSNTSSLSPFCRYGPYNTGSASSTSSGTTSALTSLSATSSTSSADVVASTPVSATSSSTAASSRAQEKRSVSGRLFTGTLTVCGLGAVALLS